ncbi:hypothetical protein ACFYNO_12000 [Kitasatospora sp. NPDC006697]|uniref:hypothetical protein n=1 Tax=Kitasatospora sp. NPDC006697 TaxID=3364020 RepID=UPI0036AA1A21
MHHPHPSDGRSAATGAAGSAVSRVETVPPLPSRPAPSGIEGILIVVVILTGIVMTILGESTAMVIELLGGLAYVAAKLVVTARTAGIAAAVQR